ncbi:MAG: protein translocase subunit SecD [Actinomycetota bacterium]|nr:protein translocase subunit SecD [Actinomycetota bacterium]
MGRGRLLAGLVAFLVAVVALWGTVLALGWTPQLGLDLQGGVSITLSPEQGQTVNQDVLDQTVAIIRNRIDALGVAEPDIARQGETVQVQLPGLTDQAQAEQVIGRTAQLQFRPVLARIPPGDPEYDTAGPPCDQPSDAVPPADREVVLCENTREPASPENPDPALLPPDQREKLRVGPVALSGTEVADARAELDPSGFNWQVNLELDGEGADKFAQVTGELACKDLADPQRQFAIVLDGVVESAPGVSEEVVCDQGITGGTAIITTGGGEADAKELALVLRTGALPIQLEIQESKSVSPTLGRSSLQAGLLAGSIGLALVAAYLVALYRGIGFAAVLELAMFGVIVLGLVIVLGNTVGFALTLAGIAGIIVSVGIAADSSIIYRERFRDELRAGRTVRTAADKAFDNAFRTNLTGNFVSFLAAIVLYVLAVGPVRGFAFTLGLSTLIDTLLMATFTRSLFGLIARTPALVRSPAMGMRAGVAAPPSDRELTGSAAR